MAQTRHNIRFLLNDRPVTLTGFKPEETVLDFLRLNERLTGTKEGCAEGDCGACTVLVGHLRDENGAQSELVYEPVNSCIRFLATLDGCHLVTIEHVKAKDGGLHPVQQAMVKHHASQCGFCSPGIVMALYGLWMRTLSPSVQEIEEALQGNLCRCTGYEPIIAAALTASEQIKARGEDPLLAERQAVIAELSAMQDGKRVELSWSEGGSNDQRAEQLALLPADLDDLATCLLAHPQATLVAGATDVGLWVTKFLRPISPIIFLGHVRELQSIDENEEGLCLGAGVTYSQAQEVLLTHYPHLAHYYSRIAGWQVRNMGTIGGNIANGSPIGDMPPVLIALGAFITLRKGESRRMLKLEDFFLAYGKQDRQEGEFVESIHIPHQTHTSLHGAYKVSKRRDEDISSVAAGFAIELDGETICAARLAFGGMAATPKRASETEKSLIGKRFAKETFEEATEQLSKDFTPLSDMRASSDYRTLVAKNLLLRFYYEKAEGYQGLEAAQ